MSLCVGGGYWFYVWEDEFFYVWEGKDLFSMWKTLSGFVYIENYMKLINAQHVPLYSAISRRKVYTCLIQVHKFSRKWESEIIVYGHVHLDVGVSLNPFTLYKQKWCVIWWFCCWYFRAITCPTHYRSGRISDFWVTGSS